jgi:hypothetical protein
MAWLHRLARLGDVNGIVEALADGDDLHAVGRCGLTPLMVAAGEGKVGVVRLLLERAAGVHQTDPDGQTALHFAARNGHLEAAKELVAFGACVDTHSASGITPLIEAARRNHSEVVDYLIKLGADPEVRDSVGRSCWEWLQVGGIAGEAETSFNEHRGELLDGLYPANVGHEHAVLRKMAEEPNAERFAAVHGRNVWCCSYGQYRFADPQIHAWAHRLAAILADRESLTACEERYLTGEELEEARAVRAKAERRARRYRAKN